VTADELHEVAKAITRIETKIDYFAASSTDHEARLRRLDRMVWTAAGAAAAAGGTVGALIANITGG
jgi:hypothetical protein